VAEWSKATDCKSVSKTHVGSNPIFLIIVKSHLFIHRNRTSYINFLNSRLKSLFYNRKLTKNNNKLYVYHSLLLFKISVLNYHYDNVYIKNFLSKVNVTISKITNFIQSSEHFFTSFVYINKNFIKKSYFFDDSLKFVLFNLTKKYILNLTGFFINNDKFKYKLSKVLVLNFKRKRFFPLIRDIPGDTFFNTSLGILSKYLQKGKFFTKKKSVFLLVASLIRKMLLYSSLKDLILMIKRTPTYLQEILSLINNPVSSLYNDPFTKKEVNEFTIKNNFNFNNVIFTTTKPYGPIKTKNKGRLKRKISKKLVLIGRVSD